MRRVIPSAPWKFEEISDRTEFTLSMSSAPRRNVVLPLLGGHMTSIRPTLYRPGSGAG